MPLNSEQVTQLLKPIKPSRIKTEGGQAHIPAYDVAAHLTRIFGFGNWDTQLLSHTCLFETGDERTGKNKDGTNRTYTVWTVGYSATVRLTIKDEVGNPVASWENGAAGDAVNQPSRADAHHLAMTTAISTALKRCAAFGLGDQFGLSLYNKGSAAMLVGKTLVGEPVGGTQPTDLESHIPKPESLGNDERQIVEDVTSGAPDAFLGDGTPPAPQPTRADGLTDLQAEIRACERYKAMSSADKGAFLSDNAGYEVKSIRDLSDDDCEQILARLRED